MIKYIIWKWRLIRDNRNKRKMIFLIYPSKEKAIKNWNCCAKFPFWINKTEDPWTLTSTTGTTYKFIFSSESIRGQRANIIYDIFDDRVFELDIERRKNDH